MTAKPLLIDQVTPILVPEGRPPQLDAATAIAVAIFFATGWRVGSNGKIVTAILKALELSGLEIVRRA
jgi:hypothetical protein